MKNIFCVALALALVGCGTSSSTSPKPVAQAGTANPIGDEAEADVGTQPKRKAQRNPEKMEVAGDVVEKPDFGRMELVKVLSVDEAYATGPFNITVTKVGVTDFQPIDSVKSAVGDRDRATLVSIAMKVENTSPETLSFHPNQGTIVVGQEQQQANIFFSEQVGGDFIGEVVKDGAVLFVLDTAPEDVSSIKYVVSPPFDSQLGAMGDELTLNFEVQ